MVTSIWDSVFDGCVVFIFGLAFGQGNFNNLQEFSCIYCKK